jgi:type I restriction enzyme M protein
MGKTNPLNDADMLAFITAQKTFANTAQSWSLDVATVNASTFDLSLKNPNGGEVVAHRSPQDIMDEIAALDVEAAEVLATIREVL